MFFKKLISLLPTLCVLCGAKSQPARNLCAACKTALPILSHHCQQCAHILPPNTPCEPCRNNPPPFDRTYALTPYQPPMIRLITQLKFHHKLSHAQLLGECLADKIQHDWYQHHPLPQLIIPVPLHPARLTERGFNQALEMARPISQILTIPIDANHTKRIMATAPQSTLGASLRGPNVAKAFIATREYKGKHLAVIDDVITTGHTVTAFCHTLKQAGADRIDVWCCARALVNIAQKSKNR